MRSEPKEPDSIEMIGQLSVEMARPLAVAEQPRTAMPSAAAEQPRIEMDFGCAQPREEVVPPGANTGGPSAAADQLRVEMPSAAAKKPARPLGGTVRTPNACVGHGTVRSPRDAECMSNARAQDLRNARLTHA